MTTEIISLISLGLVILGWIINGIMTRRHDIAKQRFEYRMQALHSFLPIRDIIEKNSAPFTDSAFLPLLEKARGAFFLYGETTEIETFEKFISAIQNKDINAVNHSLIELNDLIRLSIRRELKIK